MTLTVLQGNQDSLTVLFDTDVRGTGAGETLRIANDADVSFGASSGDRVAFTQSIDQYTFSASGNTLTVERTNGERAQIALNAETELAFADGSTTAGISVDGSGAPVVQVGGQTVGDSFDPTSVSLNQSDAATFPDAPDTGGSDGDGSDGGGSGSDPLVGSASGQIFVNNDGPTTDVPQSPRQLAIAQGGNASFNVSGNEEVAVQENLFIGPSGTGDLTISDGARVEALSAIAGGLETRGNVPQGQGNIVIKGDGSELALDGFTSDALGAAATIGGTGRGTLEIRNGGTLSIESATAGFTGLNVGKSTTAKDVSAPGGSVTVDGKGSSIEVDGDAGKAGSGGSLGYIGVGSGGSGEMTVQNGASVLNDPGGATFVGGLRGTGQGTLTVKGDNTTFEAGDQLFIGAGFNFKVGGPSFKLGGDGDLSIEDGATVSAGPESGDTGTDVYLGGTGTLTISGGGTLDGDVLSKGGTFEPGTDSGLADIDGDFVDKGTSTFEVSGTADDAYDRLEAAGDVTLAGTTTLDATKDFTPTAGDTFDIVKAGGSASVADDATVKVADFPDDLSAELSVNGSTIQAKIIDDPGGMS